MIVCLTLLLNRRILRMNCKVIAIANQKVWAGKTTTAAVWAQGMPHKAKMFYSSTLMSASKSIGGISKISYHIPSINHFPSSS